MRKRADVLQGSLDLLVLKTLTLDSLHGWAISKRIQLLSSGALEVNQGSLYPALYRLRDRGLIKSAVGQSAEGRPLRTYTLTRRGRSALEEESKNWRRFADGVEAVLAAT